MTKAVLTPELNNLLNSGILRFIAHMPVVGHVIPIDSKMGYSFFFYPELTNQKWTDSSVQAELPRSFVLVAWSPTSGNRWVAQAKRRLSPADKRYLR